MNTHHYITLIQRIFYLIPVSFINVYLVDTYFISTNVHTLIASISSRVAGRDLNHQYKKNSLFNSLSRIVSILLSALVHFCLI